MSNAITEQPDSDKRKDKAIDLVRAGLKKRKIIGATIDPNGTKQGRRRLSQRVKSTNSTPCSIESLPNP